jgi:hypothetical protein
MPSFIAMAAAALSSVGVGICSNPCRPRSGGPGRSSDAIETSVGASVNLAHTRWQCGENTLQVARDLLSRRSISIVQFAPDILAGFDEYISFWNARPELVRIWISAG